MLVNRLDRIEAPEWSTAKFEKTPEGFLRGRATITNIGVFPYLQADGTVIYELRIPDEVFAVDSLNSLRLKPVTSDHPMSPVTPENVKDVQVGNLGDNPWTPDNIHLTIDMIIQDQKAIEDVSAGKRALSCGYSCELEPAEPNAVWGGIKYDYIQKNIRYNHVAIVDVARAGDAARIRLDSLDGVLAHFTTKEATMPDLKSIKLDGVDYQAEAKVLEVLHEKTVTMDSLQVQFDTLSTEKTKIEAERDTLKDSVGTLEKKIQELEAKKLDEAVIKQAVERRVKILDAARLAEVEVKEDMAEIDIQKAVILKVFPKASLDGKDAVYIDARFDGAVEYLEKDKEEKADADVRTVGNKDTLEEKNEVRTDSKKAREKMIQDAKDAYKVK